MKTLKNEYGFECGYHTPKTSTAILQMLQSDSDLAKLYAFKCATFRNNENDSIEIKSPFYSIDKGQFITLYLDADSDHNPKTKYILVLFDENTNQALERVFKSYGDVVLFLIRGFRNVAIEFFHDIPKLTDESTFEDVKKYIKWLSNSPTFCYHIDDDVRDVFESSFPKAIVDILVKNEEVMWSFKTDPSGKNLWEHYDLNFDKFGNIIENF